MKNLFLFLVLSALSGASLHAAAHTQREKVFFHCDEQAREHPCARVHATSSSLLAHLLYAHYLPYETIQEKYPFLPSEELAQEKYENRLGVDKNALLIDTESYKEIQRIKKEFYLQPYGIGFLVQRPPLRVEPLPSIDSSDIDALYAQHESSSTKNNRSKSLFF